MNFWGGIIRQNGFLAFAVTILFVHSIHLAAQPVAHNKTWIESLTIDITLDVKQASVTQTQRMIIPSDRFRGDGTIFIGDSRFYHLKNCSVKLIDNSGELIRTIPKKDLTRVCGYGQSFVLYDDDCYYWTELAFPSYPLTIEVQTEHEVPGSFLIREMFEQTVHPINYAAITLHRSPDVPVKWKWYGEAKTNEQQSANSVRWELHNIPAWDPEPFTYGITRPIYLVIRPEQVTLENKTYPMYTWDDVADMYRRLAANRYLIDSSASQEPVREHVDSAYAEVIRKTRYVAVTMDISGWQPEFAATVDKIGYGDCKGVTTLLVSRARQQGAIAWPVLVQTDHDRKTDPSFPAVAFDHVITMAIVGRDTIWYDAVCRACPPGEIPPGDQGLLGLVVTENEGKLVRVPVSTAEQNIHATHATIVIDSSGMITWSEVSHQLGNFAIFEREYYESATAEEREDYVRQVISEGQADLVLDQMTIENQTDLQRPLVTSTLLHSTRPLPRFGPVYFDPGIFLSYDCFDSLFTSRDSGAVKIPFPSVYIDSITVTGEFLIGADSVRLPVSDSIPFPGGWFSQKWSQDGDQINGVIIARYDQMFFSSVDRKAFDEAAQKRRERLRTPLRIARPRRS